MGSLLFPNYHHIPTAYILLFQLLVSPGKVTIGLSLTHIFCTMSLLCRSHMFLKAYFISWDYSKPIIHILFFIMFEEFQRGLSHKYIVQWPWLMKLALLSGKKYIETYRSLSNKNDHCISFFLWAVPRVSHILSQYTYLMFLLWVFLFGRYYFLFYRQQVRGLDGLHISPQVICMVNGIILIQT